MWKGARDKPYKVVEYGSCPVCGNASLGIRKDGKIVRHSVGLGSVEKREWLEKRGMRTTICKGSLTQFRPRPKEAVNNYVEKLS